MSYQSTNLTQLSDVIKFRSAYSVKDRIQVSFPDQSPYTQQDAKAECDINNIMAKYQFTGQIPHINQRAPHYMDASDMDYQECMNVVVEAQQLFSELPSKLRNRFGNDPALFIEYCGDPANRFEMAQLGLLDEFVAKNILNPNPPKTEAVKPPSVSDAT